MCLFILKITQEPDIANNKGEMKGSAIAGPDAEDRANLWPEIASSTDRAERFFSVFVKTIKNELLFSCIKRTLGGGLTGDPGGRYL